MYMLDIMERAVTGALGVHSCIRVLLDGFLLKSVVFELIRKASVAWTQHEYMNIHTDSHFCAE